MPALLWFACVPLLTVYLYVFQRPSGQWREAFVQALLSMAGLSWVFTMGLSVFRLLRPLPLTLCWLSTALLLLWLIRKRRGDLTGPGFRYPVGVRHLLIGMGLILFGPLLYLTFVAPNNYDSMTYHLSRVMHWIQNGHVFHYPTAIARQLYHNPLAEYLILQPQLLSGHDYFANTIQFGAMLGSLAAVSLLARQLGLGSTGQVLAAVLAFSIPMSVFQSVSTQNDYVAGFFLLSSLLYGMNLCNPERLSGKFRIGRFIHLGKEHPEKLSGLQRLSGKIPEKRKLTLWEESPERHSGLRWLGLSLALGALTKYTVLIFALPFCLWWGIVWLRRFGWLTTLRRTAVIALCLGLFLSPFWLMNFQIFGNVLGPQPGSSLDIPMANRPVSLGHTVSNLIRNVGVHQGLPLPPWNRFADRVVYGLHQALHLDPNDPNGTYLGAIYQTQFGYTEDTANHFLHFWLFAFAFGTLVCKKLRQRLNDTGNQALLYAVCVVIGFGLFSALLRWQPMHPRLQLPLTLVSCVPVAWAFSHSRWRNGRLALGWLLLLSTFPYWLVNKSKPFLVPESLARRLTNTPNRHIPAAAFEGLLRQAPGSAALLKTNYQLTFDLQEYTLSDKASPADRRQLVALFDSVGFMKRKSVLFIARNDDYFQNRRNVQPDVEQLTAALAAHQCRSVGLDLGYEAMEYALWIFAKQAVKQPVTIRYVVYAPEMIRTPEAARPRPYDCVITEFDDTRHLYPPQAIRHYQRFGTLRLIVFRHPQTKTHIKERFLIPEHLR